jgi:hypothetical protein
MAQFLSANVISDPDFLSASIKLSTETRTAGDEVFIDTTTKKISLHVDGALEIHGVTLKCLYSFLKEEWKSNANLIQFPFPMTPITDEQFEFFNGWNLANTDIESANTGGLVLYTPELIRTGGWAVKSYNPATDTNGNDTERWASVISLGSLGETDQVYYQQTDTVTSLATTANFKLTGAVNQAVQYYSDTNGDGTADYDYSSYLRLFVREWAKTYASSALTDIGVTSLNYQAYRFPLTNSADSKITGITGLTEADANGAAAPYNNMSITWYTVGQEFTGFTAASSNAGSAFFEVIIDADVGSTQDPNPSAEQIYAFIQAKLRLETNINFGDGNNGTTTDVKLGKIVPEKLRFVGDDLFTLGQTSLSEGVYIDNYRVTDKNRLHFWGYETSTGGTEYTNIQFPFAAALTINFGENLQTDNAAEYWVFFTNDDAGSNLGRDFGTANAIIVQTNTLTDMQGAANVVSVTLEYDYDGNIQRGAGSNNTPVPITVVAIGLDKAQYVKSTTTILRTVTNSVSLVSPLERNYANP